MNSLELLFASYQIHSLDECETKNFAEICEQYEYTLLGK